MHNPFLNQGYMHPHDILVNNLLRMGVTQEQIRDMSNPHQFYNQNRQLQNADHAQISQQAKQVETVPTHQARNGDEELLLKMFSAFCVEQPETAKELSIAFTKFSRWMQSTVDKQGNQS